MTSSLESHAMERDKNILRAAKIPFRQANRYQLKHGMLNYYPDKGTIFRDGDRDRLSERGVDAFMKLCGYPKDAADSIENTSED